jgi:hypothetical protein
MSYQQMCLLFIKARGARGVVRGSRDRGVVWRIDFEAVNFETDVDGTHVCEWYRSHMESLVF